MKSLNEDEMHYFLYHLKQEGLRIFFPKAVKVKRDQKEIGKALGEIENNEELLDALVDELYKEWKKNSDSENKPKNRERNVE